MRLLRDIAHRRGIIVLVICHDLNVASRFSDRMIMFSQGRIYADGTPEEVITPETIHNVYRVNADVTTVQNRPYVIYYAEGENDNALHSERYANTTKETIVDGAEQLRTEF